MAATALLSNTAEGGTNGADVTIANSGGGSGDAFDPVVAGSGNTITYDNSWTINGSLSYKLVQGGTANCLLFWSWDTAQDDFCFRFPFRMDELPASGHENPLIRLFSDGDVFSAIVMDVNVRPSGTVRIRDGVAGTFSDESPSALNAATDYVLMFRYTASTKTAQAVVYPKGSATAYTSASMTIPTDTAINSTRFGIGAASTGVTLHLDDLAVGYGGWLDRTDLPASDTAAPTSVTSNDGGWTANTGTIVDAVADGDVTSTYISDSEGAIVLRLAPMTGAPGTITVTADAGSDTQTLKVELLQGSTVIASDTFSMTTSPDDYTLATTSTERGNVTDATSLDVRLTAS